MYKSMVQYAWNRLVNIYLHELLQITDKFPPTHIISRHFWHLGHIPSSHFSTLDIFPPRSLSTPDIFPPVINLKMPFALHPLITQNAANSEGIIFQLLKKQCKIT